MTKPIIEVSHVSKRYTLGTIGATRFIDEVERLFQRAVGKQTAPDAHEFRALEDVSFSVEAGDVIGLIGRNGAGKSTMLKILSRITEPTMGEVILRGRVASLLEVGTGFVGDLSGRDNVFLNGAILGMTRQEIRSKFDEIVAFAEVDNFIDTPVKRYSSGMYVRLAFAVAAHLEPEILIVDEVLAVGDAQFQKKCLGKMGDVSREGRTILFVSHNMTAIQSLCRRAIMLRGGQVVADDVVANVMERYMDDSRQTGNDRSWEDASSAPGTDNIRVKSLRIRPPDVSDTALLTMQAPIIIETEYWVLRADATNHLTYHLINDQGITVLTCGSTPAERETGVYVGRFTLPANLLNSGTYFLRLFIIENGNRVGFSEEGFGSFAVVDAAPREYASHNREPGVIQISLPWSVDRISDSSNVATQ